MSFIIYFINSFKLWINLKKRHLFSTLDDTRVLEKEKKREIR